jgi:electron transfer flavoprotein beta subunit
MDIIVCIKQVPGSSKVEVDPVTGVLKRNAGDAKMNPYDLYALETALRIKEHCGGFIKVITMGPPHAKEIIREAYMMGVDDGTLLTDRRFGGADVLATSYALSQGIQKLGGFDLILCGKQTTDGDTAQVGPETAEYLGIPHIANVLAILEIKEDSVIVEMDMPETVEVVQVRLPCLLTVEKDICQPRLPSYVKKLSTKDKEIRIFTLDDFDDRNEKNYGLSGSATQVEKIFPPTVNKNRESWTGDPSELGARIAAKWKELKFIR